MGKLHLIAGATTLGLALSLAGCASEGGLLGGATGATEPTASIATARPRVDTACAPLAQKIDELRREGSVDRVEQAAAGKGATVQVKRESLVKVAELNKAHAEFQSKCSTFRPAPGQAKAVTLTPGAAETAAVTKTAAAATGAARAPGEKAKTAAADTAKTAQKAATAPAKTPAKAPPPVEDAGETKKE